MSTLIPAKTEATELSATAERLAKEMVCSDLGLFSAWLDQQAGGEREHSSFGPISTQDLVTLVLLNPNATDEQLARAAREVRTRYLNDESAEVARLAQEVMQ